MGKFERWYLRILGSSLLTCALLETSFGKICPEGTLALVSLIVGVSFSVFLEICFTKQKNVV